MKYEGIKEFLVEFSNQEVALGKAAPKVPISHLEEEVGVDALGKGKGKGSGCWTCGDLRYQAWNCPKGGGKGAPKGGPRGDYK